MKDSAFAHDHRGTGASCLAPRFLLQRKCGCTTHPLVGGSCPSCEEERAEGNLQRAAMKAEPANEVPGIVHEVLGSPGQPLDVDTRAFVEPRLGHDFSRVRVHTDAQAAASARSVKALAYTVGSDVVFGSGQYAPETKSGRRLLVHELTHVVQQSSRLQRSSISPALHIGPEDDELEREADEAAKTIDETEGGNLSVLQGVSSERLQRAPAIIGMDDAGPDADLTGGGREAELLACVKRSGPDPNQCDPTGALTWANFQGSPQAGSPYGAVTGWEINPVDVPIQDCMKLVMGKTTGPTKRFQAHFDSAKSWVKAETKDAADVTKNGCAPLIGQCKTAFANPTPGQSIQWALSTTPDPLCPGSATPRGDRASTSDECDTKVGVDCTDRMQAESARLLRHEQLHFDLSCVFAKKANAALIAGGNLEDIKQALNDKAGPTQTQYDTETSHGCTSAAQATWAKDLADGLPNITIP